ncbi:MAG: MFS transporter [Saprospiraceae bacterium]|nr:MFS transporter [Saprospiraceae bacterium]
MENKTYKTELSFWQIWNMSFGFLGIQFGWALQMSNMSAIYKYLGAENSQIPLLWIAAPMTGLIVQPIVGYLSDNTWNFLGRRKPYFLVGAILASISLVLMPNCTALWMAAGLLWILDASINISMEPFRAFVSDMLPEKQLTTGFTMQSFFIGLGAVVASAMPWIFTNWFQLGESTNQGIPSSVKYSFYIGAFVFFIAILYTILTTKEYPPLIRKVKNKESIFIKTKNGFNEIFSNILDMPILMKKIAIVQFFSWMGLFLMWFHFSDAVATNFYKASSLIDPSYKQGVEFAGLLFAFYSLVTFCFAFILKFIADKIGKARAHQWSLAVGGLALISVLFLNNPNHLFINMIGVGIAWTSILSMPYAIFAPHLPEGKTGVYMGIFNFFIVIPEIIAALCFGWVMKHILYQNSLHAVALGGLMLIFASILCMLIKEEKKDLLSTSLYTIPEK